MTRRVKTESVEAKIIITKLLNVGYTTEQIEQAVDKYKVTHTTDNRILEEVK